MANPVRSRNLAKALSVVRGVVTLTIGLLIAGSPALAQFTAGIQGNVRDASGANIPHAHLILLNTATKVQQVGTTDASGLYRIPDLGPGEYQISASATGFARTQVDFTLTA